MWMKDFRKQPVSSIIIFCTNYTPWPSGQNGFTLSFSQLLSHFILMNQKNDSLFDDRTFCNFALIRLIPYSILSLRFLISESNTFLEVWWLYFQTADKNQQTILFSPSISDFQHVLLDFWLIKQNIKKWWK